VIHTHSTNWTALHVYTASDGSLLRAFGALGGSARLIAIAQPTAARLFTLQGPDVAVWCR